MGNDNTQYSTNYSLINHPKFQRSQIIISKNLMKVQFPIQHQSQVFKWDKKLQNYKQQFQSAQYLLLPKYYQLSQKGFCGSNSIISIYYQMYPYIFQDQIQNRIQNNQYFSQSQLWYLLYALATSANQFSRVTSNKIGDIRPLNIFFNQTGQIKIANLLSWPGQLSNYQKSYYDRQITLLSPQQILSYSKNTQNPIDLSNYQLCQSFSIGLTILQAGLLNNLSSLYNFRTFKMDYIKFMEKFKEWSELIYYSRQFNKNMEYSPQLKNIILGLCQIDPKKRLNSLEVYKWLIPYQKQIIQMKKFRLQQHFPINRQSRYNNIKNNNYNSNFNNKFNFSQSNNYKQKSQEQYNTSKYNQNQIQRINQKSYQNQNNNQNNRQNEGVTMNHYYHKPNITFNNNFQTSNVLKIQDLASHPFQFKKMQKFQSSKFKNNLKENTQGGKQKDSLIKKFQTFNLNQPSEQQRKYMNSQPNIAISKSIQNIQKTKPPAVIQTHTQNVIDKNKLTEAKEVQSQYKPDGSSFGNTLKSNLSQLINCPIKQQDVLSLDILKKIQEQIKFSKAHFPN